MARALALLAQPEPEGEGVSNEDRQAIVVRLRELAFAVTEGPEALAREGTMSVPPRLLRDADIVLSTAADILAHYTRPTIKPVPVAERLPEAEDCDAEGLCWWWFADRAIAGQPQNCGRWHFTTSCASLVRTRSLTHWLPHHSLPVPHA